MDLLKSLNSSWKIDLIVKSLVWNSVIEVFQEQKSIDITPYLISVVVKKNLYVVKTNKPVISSQGYLLYDLIKERIWEKISKVWVKYTDFEVKFV